MPGELTLLPLEFPVLIFYEYLPPSSCWAASNLINLGRLDQDWASCLEFNQMLFKLASP